MEIEIWVDVPGYENIYKISSYGNIKSVRANKIMKQSLHINGYYKIDLNMNRKRKTFKTHQLVAIAF